MGFETFRVELRGGQVPPIEVDDVIQKLPHLHPDVHSIPLKGSAYFVLDDGEHLIELERMDAPVRLSCRFTLCHPPSVDVAFLGLVRELMFRLGMEAKLCDPVAAGYSGFFSLADFSDFAAITRHRIADRRAEWTAAFGDEPMALSTNEVYERVVLPKCEPLVASEGPV